jgi:hypothetical protein
MYRGKLFKIIIIMLFAVVETETTTQHTAERRKRIVASRAKSNSH